MILGVGVDILHLPRNTLARRILSSIEMKHWRELDPASDASTRYLATR
jgi:phosphopantetheinyl transferase (holo-ACP synthase)